MQVLNVPLPEQTVERIIKRDVMNLNKIVRDKVKSHSIKIDHIIREKVPRGLVHALEAGKDIITVLHKKQNMC